ncbi:MAG: hypothetical protein GY708_25060 [Actinomycetia bacterium]|nr:hypothetical protein [Actinomycetes bacterium]
MALPVALIGGWPDDANTRRSPQDLTIPGLDFEPIALDGEPITDAEIADRQVWNAARTSEFETGLVGFSAVSVERLEGGTTLIVTRMPSAVEAISKGVVVHAVAFDGRVLEVEHTLLSGEPLEIEVLDADTHIVRFRSTDDAGYLGGAWSDVIVGGASS